MKVDPQGEEWHEHPDMVATPVERFKNKHLCEETEPAKKNGSRPDVNGA
jgi:hypothetical protein